MLRALKFSGLVAVNLVVAVIGTAILDTLFRRAIPPHSIAALIWKECVLSIVCAAFIGFGMWRTWRNSAAKWTWVPASAWFALGLLAVARHGKVVGQLFGFGIWGPGAAEVRSFFAFTVPLVRAVSYSVGAYVSSLLYAAPVAPESEAAARGDS